MKKLYYFLLLALPMFFVTSCDDEKNLPEVQVSVEISGGVEIDHTIYVVAGETFSVDGITVKSVDENKSAIITEAAYSWDYGPALYSVNPPFGASFVTSDASVGIHLLQIQCPLFAVDKSPAVMYMVYRVVVVSSADDIPDGTASTVFVDQPGIKEK